MGLFYEVIKRGDGKFFPRVTRTFSDGSAVSCGPFNGYYDSKEGAIKEIELKLEEKRINDLKNTEESVYKIEVE